MTLRNSYARFEAWLDEHTAAEFLLYLLVTASTFGGAHFFLSNRQFLYSVTLGLAFGVAFATVMTFVDFP